jgi:hypothetical protein
MQVEIQSFVKRLLEEVPGVEHHKNMPEYVAWSMLSTLCQLTSNFKGKNYNLFEVFPEILNEEVQNFIFAAWGESLRDFVGELNKFKTPNYNVGDIVILSGKDYENPCYAWFGYVQNENLNQRARNDLFHHILNAASFRPEETFQAIDRSSVFQGLFLDKFVRTDNDMRYFRNFHHPIIFTAWPKENSAGYSEFSAVITELQRNKSNSPNEAFERMINSLVPLLSDVVSTEKLTSPFEIKFSAKNVKNSNVSVLIMALPTVETRHIKNPQRSVSLSQMSLIETTDSFVEILSTLSERKKDSIYEDFVKQIVLT